jgi:hypothetical protein
MNRKVPLALETTDMEGSIIAGDLMVTVTPGKGPSAEVTAPTMLPV